MELIGSLMAGASLYIPSEEDKMDDLAGYINSNAIQHLILTPSVVRTLRAKDLPTVNLIFLGGETVTQEILDNWFSRVRLFNAWGPAEATVCSSFHEYRSKTDHPSTVGKSTGGFCWIVDPEDHEKLAPIGTVGEVIIQGPTITREYLGDKAKTEQTIRPAPQWAPFRDEEGWDRIYKSGDLCFYNSEGDMQFVSRKDTQIKIRGLRVELGEVEHHVLEGLSGVRHVAVDVIRTGNSSNLVAYFCYNDEMRVNVATDQSIFLPFTANLSRRVMELVGKLNLHLPSYMVPTIFIPCSIMPANTSLKLDRKTLGKTVDTLSHSALSGYSLANLPKRQPETVMEYRMQALWAHILDIPEEGIGRDDSFLRLGGDSIKAAQLSAIARDSGVQISVKDIFLDPRLSAVSTCACTIEADRRPSGEIRPFDLLPSGMKEIVLSPKIRARCDLKNGQIIENAMPVTSLQEGFMALSAKQSGSYMAKWVYRIAEHVDLDDFREAWEATVEACRNLRTRLVRVSNQTVQLHVKNDVDWEDTAKMDLRAFLLKVKDMEMGLGSRLCRYALVKGSSPSENFFVFVAHHAIYDGWTMRLILGTLSEIYKGNAVTELKPYDYFIKYILDTNLHAAKAYWRHQLQDACRPAFPALEPKARTTARQSF
uniref:Carrier domain-containing protein n=1 Tax=Bionectria ochroleuca TaxID=29856 RepID=A0A8H7K5W8_BIOOC